MPTTRGFWESDDWLRITLMSLRAANGGQGPIFTIGHSDHELSRFVRLLREHDVRCLVDVRSQPYSRRVPQFNRETLDAALEAGGIRYLFLGDELGGRPQGSEYYDDEGHVLYRQRADAPEFRAGLQTLMEVSPGRAAIMCSEENPENCHRQLLVGAALEQMGVSVRHIRGDGRLEEAYADQDDRLFSMPREIAWRSTRSVSQREAQRSSFEP